MPIVINSGHELQRGKDVRQRLTLERKCRLCSWRNFELNQWWILWTFAKRCCNYHSQPPSFPQQPAANFSTTNHWFLGLASVLEPRLFRAFNQYLHGSKPSARNAKRKHSLEGLITTWELLWPAWCHLIPSSDCTFLTKTVATYTNFSLLLLLCFPIPLLRGLISASGKRFGNPRLLHIILQELLL